MKKAFSFIILIVAILVAAYLLQPIRKGRVPDSRPGYELVNNWPRLPDNFKLGNPVGLGIDTSENIVVFHRGDREWPWFGSIADETIKSKTILIIHKETGKIISSWGDNLFIMPHGLTVDYQNNIWLTDVALHQIFKFTHDGKLLMRLGERSVPGHDQLHFNQPTDIAVAGDGSFYVCDGYGNSRVIKFSATGQYLLEWGKAGTEKGEFNTPHAIVLDSNENVYVADRENNRIQVFDPNGNFVKEFSDNTFGAMCSLAFNSTWSELFAVDDLRFLKVKHRGSDLIAFNASGKVQTRFGRTGSYTGSKTWYHDLTVDREENIYIGDILENRIQKFRKITDR